MINRDIVIIGPFDGPVTGQQFITNYTATLVNKRLTLISTGGINISNIKFIALWFKGFIKLTQICMLKKSRFIVYLSISRSWAGFVKESYISFLQRIFKFTLVIHWHGAEPRLWVQGINPTLSRFFHMLWRGAALNIALTSSMAQDLKCLGFRNTSVVRNFPNINEKNFDQVFIAPNNKTVRFLFLSNLLQGKGLEDAIYSLNSIPNKNFTLDIVGSNYSSSSVRYKKLIESCVFAKYHGCVEGFEKERLLKNCDVLVFPSTYRTEALPLAVIEAIFAGLVVVAYDHNYMSEFSEIQGVIITKPDPEKLSEVLNALCMNSMLLEKLKRANLRGRQIFSKTNYELSISKLLNDLC
jgi:glycosyltransferase involved in cell wall biosynthesis